MNCCHLYFFICHSTDHFSITMHNKAPDSSQHVFTFTCASPSALWICSFCESTASPTSCTWMLCGSDKSSASTPETLRTAFYVLCTYCLLPGIISSEAKAALSNHSEGKLSVSSLKHLSGVSIKSVTSCLKSCSASLLAWLCLDEFAYCSSSL